MYSVEEVIKVGDKYYLAVDVQKVLEVRINSLDLSLINLPVEE